MLISKLVCSREGGEMRGKEAKELLDMLVRDGKMEEEHTRKLLSLYGSTIGSMAGQLLEMRRLVHEDYVSKVTLESQLLTKQKHQQRQQL
jgi:hypothetical protein